jgi:predicted phosphodiesterase
VLPPRRWLTLALIALSVALLVDLGGDFLEDRGIRLTGLITLDPPPSPVVIRLDGHTFSVMGAFVQAVQSDRVSLRAWLPTPTIRVIEPGDPSQITLDVENLPLRVRLDASGPVKEDRRGPTRTLRFAPQATRRVGFTDLEHEVTFAVLGDTGDSATFRQALGLAACQGADFLIHAGDLIYRDEQIPHLKEILATSPLPVFTVRGNHDYRNEARINVMRGLSPAYYAFRMGGATFVILDNGISHIPSLWRRSTQYQWLTNVLGMPREGPLFVAMHKPPFDPRPAPQEHAMEDKGFAQALMRSFARAGVDAVLTGHVHASYLWVRDGIPYVINGEGFTSPAGSNCNRMAWVHVRGWEVTIAQIPIWGDGEH